MLTPTQVKNSNLDSQKTVVHLCAKVPHELPRRAKAKIYSAHSVAGNKSPSQTVGQKKMYTGCLIRAPVEKMNLMYHVCIVLMPCQDLGGKRVGWV